MVKKIREIVCNDAITAQQLLPMIDAMFLCSTKYGLIVKDGVSIWKGEGCHPGVEQGFSSDFIKSTYSLNFTYLYNFF